MYHLDDIGNYLDKYTNIVNGISILDCAFVDMAVLKPIYAAVALPGIHVLKPYHYLLMDTETKYSMLLEAFPQLYNELTNVAHAEMMKMNQCFNFVSKDIFKKKSIIRC